MGSQKSCTSITQFEILAKFAANMNVSFDSFGADAGWGDEVETVSQANIPDPRRSIAGLSAILEKITFPVTFKSLCQLPPNAEKYIINNYTFLNVGFLKFLLST